MATADRSGRGVAFARAALAGNPSDAYGGAVLALAFGDFHAEAWAVPAPTPSITPPSSLVEAAVRRFRRELAPGAAAASAVEWTTSIPRGVGLGGSSAIVIATIHALCELHDVRLERPELASLALAVETEELGIAAGPQDRVVQAYGGLTFMDFGGRPVYEQLEPLLLPPLVVAWQPDAGEHSGHVHGDLRARFEQGDQTVRSAIAELASLARDSRAALLAGQRDAFARCVEGSFEARRRITRLDPRHERMIEAARACGAGANYTGSGGAIVAVADDAHHRDVVTDALRAAGYATVWPSVA
jgi:galactokinase/mevalonate kinase-like predicted kinase